MSKPLANSPLYTCGAAMQALCSPLEEYLGIREFTFERVYNNHTKIKLTNQPEWMDCYYNQFYHLDCDKNMEGIQAGLYFTADMGAGEIFNLCRTDYQIGNGILIVDSYQNYKELIWITTDYQDTYSNSYFLHKLEMLRNFIFYFKDRGRKLIEQALSKPIKMPHLVPSLDVDASFSDAATESFFSAIKTNHFHFNIQGEDIKLSRAEIVCGIGLVNGKTAPDIANDLCRSNRTIETHIQNLKNKFACSSKADLISLLTALNINVLQKYYP